MKLKPLKLLALGALTITPLLFASCTYKDYLKEVAEEEGLTKEQAELVPHAAYTKEFLTVNPDGTREINYDAWMTNEAVLEKLTKMEGVTKDILGTEDPQLKKMIDEFPGMKESIEKEQRIIQY